MGGTGRECSTGEGLLGKRGGVPLGNSPCTQVCVPSGSPPMPACMHKALKRPQTLQDFKILLKEDPPHLSPHLCCTPARLLLHWDTEVEPSKSVVVLPGQEMQ